MIAKNKPIEKAIMPHIDPREITFLVMLHNANANDVDKIIWCKDRDELNQLIEGQKANPDHPSGLRVFGVERDIEFGKA